MGDRVRRRRIGLREVADPVGLSWDEPVQAFLRHEECRGLRPRTVELDAQELRLFRRWLERRLPGAGPAEVTEGHLADFVLELRNRGRSRGPSTSSGRPSSSSSASWSPGGGWLTTPSAPSPSRGRAGSSLKRCRTTR